VKFDEAAVKAWVAGVLRGIYQPLPKEEIWEWAERTLRIPATENEELAGTLWSSSLTPYVRELMRWVKRPGKGEFWIMKSSQVGFTMACLIIICWMIVHQPANTLYAINSVTEATRISKTRLKRWIEDNRLLDQVGEGSSDDLSNLTYTLRGMTVYLIGAHSAGAWKNKSIALCILDELDEHEHLEGTGSTVNEARSRLKRPKNAKLIGFSTPGRMDHIHGLWEKGTQEEVHLPFPCCQHFQPLKWDNLVFGTKEFRDLAGDYDREKIRLGAHFKCELCGRPFLDEQKRKALQACRSVATNDKGNPSMRSLHLWDAYSPFVTFGDLALEWIDAQGDETLKEGFMRNRRGQRYERHGKELKHSDVLALRNPLYARGQLHFEPVLLAQLVDIQGDLQKTVKVAFDEKGDIFLIDWKETAYLEEAVDWAYDPVPGPADSEWIVTCGFIDEGHKMKEVREICLDHTPVFWPVKGRGDSQIQHLIATSEKWVRGDDYILTYHINEAQFKWQLLTLIADHKRRAEKGEMRLHLPHDVDEHDPIIAELCNERPENNTKTKKWEWKKKGPNDFWDCVKYGLALWSVMRPLIQREGATREYQLRPREEAVHS
jgi:phage terminase large subunit GpA-like protein